MTFSEFAHGCVVLTPRHQHAIDTMSSPTNSRKRKADVLEAADASEPKSGVAVSSSHLPASCLAAVLNFLPYSDVRRCMLAGKIMAVEAASQVETLNFTKPSQLVGPAARRFANVSELNILCLVSPDGPGIQQALSETTATRATPFMTIFPKLKSALFGGVFCHRDRMIPFSYDMHYCRRPRDYNAVFRVLVESLCGAFQAQMLSADLDIKGLQLMRQLECKITRNLNEEDSGTHCRFCRSIIASFPSRSVMSCISINSFCPSTVSCLDAFLKRSDGTHALNSDEGKEMLVQLLNMHIGTYQMSLNEHPDFSRRLMKEGATFLQAHKFHLVHYLSPKSISRLKGIIQAVSSDAVRSIPSTFFSRGLFRYPERKSIVLQDTMDTLIDLGFNLSPNDFVIVDMHTEPALADFKAMLQRQQVEEAGGE